MDDTIRKIQSLLSDRGRVVASTELKVQVPHIRITLFPGQKDPGCGLWVQIADALDVDIDPTSVYSEILAKVPVSLALVVEISEDVSATDAAYFLRGLHSAHQACPRGVLVIGPVWIHDPDPSVLGSTFGGSAFHFSRD